MNDWIVAKASVPGRLHIEVELPCQDAHKVTYLDNSDWGIAIVSDGAGSASESHIGSGKIVELGIEVFSNIILNSQWEKEHRMPMDKEWLEDSILGLKKIYFLLKEFSIQEDYDFKELAGTIILICFSKKGLLLAHIGDGRAGYRTIEGQWKSMMTPYKGEEANETVFITSNFWEKDDLTTFIGTSIITQEISAFTAMTDGVEAGSYILIQYDEGLKKYKDYNLPFPGFFEPAMDTILKLNEEGLEEHEIDNLWESFLTDGTERFKYESDDRTLILAVNKNINPSISC